MESISIRNVKHGIVGVLASDTPDISPYSFTLKRLRVLSLTSNNLRRDVLRKIVRDRHIHTNQKQCHNLSLQRANRVSVQKRPYPFIVGAPCRPQYEGYSKMIPSGRAGVSSSSSSSRRTCWVVADA